MLMWLNKLVNPDWKLIKRDKERCSVSYRNYYDQHMVVARDFICELYYSPTRNMYKVKERGYVPLMYDPKLRKEFTNLKNRLNNKLKSNMKKKIFVYGTLLEGLGNWSWALNHEGAKKLGTHTLKGTYTMVSHGGFPAVINHKEGNTDIHGEVFEVDDETYESIEHLEGYPSFYDKEVVVTPWGDAEMYVQGEKQLTLPKIENGNWKARLLNQEYSR